MALNAPVVGMAATPDGGGYWLVAADGGIFSYGDAGFFGSAGALHAGRARSSGMAAGPGGGGYWLVARDGGIFGYGDAPYHGSLGGTALPAPVVGMAAAPRRRGLLARPGVAAPLAGKVVGIDPGHNGLNYSAPGVIDQPVFNGTGLRAVRHDGHGDRQRLHRGAVQLRRGHLPAGRPRGGGGHRRADPARQRRRGAVRHDPGRHHQRAHADVAVDIHADGGPPGGRGFSVLEPVADGPNDGVVGSSAAFAGLLRDAFVAGTPMPVSTYDGVDGLQPRNDLAGLNLTTVPKVLIECGNMRNATDAALLVDPCLPTGGGGRHGPGRDRVPDRATPA